MNHAKHILSPGRWSNWPWLTLKRRKEPSLGCLMDEDRVKGFTVYLVNLYDLPKTEEEFTKAGKLEYPTIEAMLADGWEVD